MHSGIIVCGAGRRQVRCPDIKCQVIIDKIEAEDFLLQRGRSLSISSLINFLLAGITRYIKKLAN